MSFCHKKYPIIKHLVDNDNDKMVEVVHKKLSLLRVCIRRNAGLGHMTRIRCTLCICLGKEDRLSKKKSSWVGDCWL